MLQSFVKLLAFLDRVRDRGLFVILFPRRGALDLVDDVREEVGPFNLDAVRETEAGEVHCGW